MKRIYSSTFNSFGETETVMKRGRADVSPLTGPLGIVAHDRSPVLHEPIVAGDSGIEPDDDDDIEIIYENLNSRFEHINSTIGFIPDPDEERIINIVNDDSLFIQCVDSSMILPPTSPLAPATVVSSVEFVETIERDAPKLVNPPELIDLTEDEAESNSGPSNVLDYETSLDLQECPICLETFSDLQNTGVYLFITECSHVMCTLCSHQSLALSPRCPLCRTNLSSTTLKPFCILT